MLIIKYLSVLNEKFYTTEQVASMLQVHPFTILKFIKQGKLKGIKLGRVYRILESDVENFLQERMTGTKPTTKIQKETQVEKTETKTLKEESGKLDKDEEHYYII